MIRLVKRFARWLFGRCPKCGNRLRKGSAYHGDGRPINSMFGCQSARYCPELHWGYYETWAGDCLVRHICDWEFDAISEAGQ